MWLGEEVLWLGEAALAGVEVGVEVEVEVRGCRGLVALMVGCCGVRALQQTVWLRGGRRRDAAGAVKRGAQLPSCIVVCVFVYQMCTC